MLLGYSFEPRPNSLALATADSLMTIGLSIKDDRTQKNNLTRENKID